MSRFVRYIYNPQPPSQSLCPCYFTTSPERQGAICTLPFTMRLAAFRYLWPQNKQRKPNDRGTIILQYTDEHFCVYFADIVFRGCAPVYGKLGMNS